MLLSCPAKKVTKESTGAHRRFLWSTLTGKTCQIPRLSEGGLFHDVRPAVFPEYYLSGKKSEHFLSEQDLS